MPLDALLESERLCELLSSLLKLLPKPIVGAIKMNKITKDKITNPIIALFLSAFLLKPY